MELGLNKPGLRFHMTAMIIENAVFQGLLSEDEKIETEKTLRYQYYYQIKLRL